MSTTILAVDATELIQPLLTSLLSGGLSQYPPALLPHLSPILRQRVKLLCDGTAPWLPLLSYNEETGKELLSNVMRSEMLEPHPVSGEVELDIDLKNIDKHYARLDEETMVAKIEVEELGMEVRGTYCLNDTEGGGSGWRISEVGTIGASFKGETEIQNWSGSTTEAEQQWRTKSTPKVEEPQQEEEDDDAAYWAQYDNEASSTPAPLTQPSPAPMGMGHGGSGNEEDDYYARYGSVQPAMDGHDPDEAVEGVDSGLGNHHVAQYNHTAQAQPEETHIVQPRPHSSSHSSTSSGARSAIVSALEEKAEADSIQHSPVVVSPLHLSPASQPSVDRETQSEVAIRQHISTSLKSMYRLARATGMDREAFRDLVEREAALCGMEEDEL